jgi:hypothetical protein
MDWLLASSVGRTFTDLGRGDWGPADRIADVAEWLPPAAVGLLFTLIGVLKLYGLRRGIVGGHDKPLAVQLCGT